MTIPKDNSQLENARRLRREMTPHERKLWYLFLRKHPAKIYKQRIIGRFIVDFYCASAKLVIEIDGSQHYQPQSVAYDAERSTFLSSLGLDVLRFSNRDIDRDFRGVCKLTLLFKTVCKTLSVTCGDSSPKGRAKAARNRMYGYKKWSVSTLIRSKNCFTDTRRTAGFYINVILSQKPEGTAYIIKSQIKKIFKEAFL